jgi:FtsZ-interacting cell division protein ZipA
MDTLAVIAIIVGALVLIAILVVLARRGQERREVGHAQVEAQHDDVQHHRGRAEEKRSEAELAEERAKRARAEAELDERRAGEREREVRDSE